MDNKNSYDMKRRKWFLLLQRHHNKQNKSTSRLTEEEKRWKHKMCCVPVILWLCRGNKWKGKMKWREEQEIDVWQEVKKSKSRGQVMNGRRERIIKKVLLVTHDLRTCSMCFLLISLFSWWKLPEMMMRFSFSDSFLWPLPGMMIIKNGFRCRWCFLFLMNLQNSGHGFPFITLWWWFRIWEEMMSINDDIWMESSECDLHFLFLDTDGHHLMLN